MMRPVQISKSILITFLSCILLKLTLANTQVNYVEHFCADVQNIYSQNSTYNANLNLFLSNLSSEASSSSLYNNYTATIGNKTINGLFFCRGDLSLQLCHDCIDAATENISQTCAGQMEGLIWYQECMLWYSSRDIITIADESIWSYLSDYYDLSNNDQFNEKLSNTMNDLINKAAFGSSIPPKFATHETNVSVFQKLYCLVQCNPSITGNECEKCLQFALTIDPPPNNCTRRAMIFIAGCQLMYDINPFYSERSSADANRPPASSTDGNDKKGISTTTLVAIIVPVAASAAFFTILCYCFLIKKKEHTALVEDNIAVDEITKVHSLQYDLRTIETATNNFSIENKIGEGGFGDVYKGMLANGREVAVKRLSEMSRQGAEQFKNEVVLVAELQHRNLVRLLGFCAEGKEKILIYEYVPNKSLDHLLFDPERRGQLDWSRRYKIIEGIARGILYLHEDSRLKIIHRDLKPSNIPLDANMNPKVSDFGIARIFGVDQSLGNTNRIVGTFGYMSPEYAMHGYFSVKSDVYSFGVLILEIISGQKNSHFYQPGCTEDLPEDLLSYAWKLWKEDVPLELVDETIRDSYSRNEVLRCIQIGLLCVQEDPDVRPTMASVMLMLNSFSVTLSLPQKPALCVWSRTRSGLSFPIKGLESDQSTSKSMPSSVNDVSITELEPR